MRTSSHRLRVCAVLAPRFPVEFCTRVFLCFACFASQTPGLCSAFPSAPFEFVRSCLSRVLLCILCLTNSSFVQCFFLGSHFKLHAYIGIYFYVLIFADLLFLVLFASSLASYCFLFYCCFSSTRFSTFSVIVRSALFSTVF